MLSSSSSTQVQAKQLITSLCKVLEWLVGSVVTPEDFRLAKFDKPEVSEKMVVLVDQLIKFVQKDTTESHTRFESDEDFAEYVSSVKKRIIKLGYASQDFLDMSESLERPVSSRECLIAVAWLLYHYNIIENNNWNDLIELEYFKSLQPVTDQVSEELPELQSDDIHSKIDYIKFLMGKFKFHIGSLESCMTERVKLTSRAHLVTKANRLDLYEHLSCLEIHLLKNPTLIEPYQKELEKRNDIQQSVLYWIKYHDCFWKWMESVLDEKQLEEIRQKVESNEDTSTSYSQLYRTGLLDLLEEKKSSVESVLSRVNQRSSTLKNIEMSMKSECSLTTQDLDDLANQYMNSLKSYETELSNRVDRILDERISETVSSSGDPRLALKSRLSKTSTSVMKTTNDTAQKRIDRLKSSIDTLKSVYEEKRLDLIEKCEQIISNLSEDCELVYNK